MPRCLLSVPLHNMRQAADCLAACVAMVLDYLGHPVDYDRLLHLLDVGPFGTPAERVRRLAQWGITVEYGEGEPARLAGDEQPLRPHLSAVSMQASPNLL